MKPKYVVNKKRIDMKDLKGKLKKKKQKPKRKIILCMNKQINANKISQNLYCRLLLINYI